MRRISILALVLVIAGVAAAGPRGGSCSSCPGGSCSPSAFVQPAPVVAQPAPVAGYEWRTKPDDPGRRYLFLGGVQVGGYDVAERYYRPFDDRTNVWGPKGRSPFPPPTCICRPCECGDNCDCAGGERRVVSTVVPTGVDRSGLTGRDRLTYGGREIEPHQLYSGEFLKDDWRKPYLTIIGDDGFLTQAKSALAPGGKYAALTEQFVIGYFNASDWHVSDVGYRRPGVSIMGPRDASGKARELHYQPDLDDLDKAVLVALRNPDPEYKPEKTPDLRKPPKPEPKPEPEPMPEPKPVTPEPKPEVKPETKPAEGHTINALPACCVLALGLFVLLANNNRSKS